MNRLANETDRKFCVCVYEYGYPEKVVALAYHTTWTEALEDYNTRLTNDEFNSSFGRNLTVELSQAYDGDYLTVKIDTYVKG